MQRNTVQIHTHPMAKKSSSKISKEVSNSILPILKKTLQIISQGIRFVFEVIKSIFIVIYTILKLLFDLFKSIWLGLSTFIAAIALLIFSVSLGIWLIGSVIGLNQSESFQDMREEMLSEIQSQWKAEQLERKQYRAAKKAKVKIAEISEISCQQDSDCETPVDYLTRSSCPYTSKCLENQCAVVCPKEF